MWAEQAAGNAVVYNPFHLLSANHLTYATPQCKSGFLFHDSARWQLVLSVLGTREVAQEALGDGAEGEEPWNPGDSTPMRQSHPKEDEG